MARYDLSFLSWRSSRNILPLLQHYLQLNSDDGCFKSLLSLTLPRSLSVAAQPALLDWLRQHCPNLKELSCMIEYYTPLNRESKVGVLKELAYGFEHLRCLSIRLISVYEREIGQIMGSSAYMHEVFQQPTNLTQLTITTGMGRKLLTVDALAILQH